MLLTLLALCILIASGYMIARRWGGAVFDSSLDMLAGGSVVACASVTALASVAGIFLPTIISFFFALFVIAAVGMIAWRQLQRRKELIWIRPDLAKRNRLAFDLALAVGAAAIITGLVWNSFAVGADGLISLAAGAGVDVPYHLGQITHIAYTTHLDFEEPYFSGEFIRYPFFINLLSGVFLKLGASLWFSFHAPLLLLTFAGMILLTSFFRSLGLGKSLAASGVAITLFGAGLGYIAWIFSPDIANISLPIRNHVPFPLQNISYPGAVPGFLIVQRPFFFGLPLFLIVVMSFLAGVRVHRKQAFVWCGFALGMLPLSHSHSFLAASLVIGFGILMLMWSRHAAFFDSIRGVVFTSAALAIPQLAALLLLPKYPLGGSMAARLGWMARPGEVGGLNLLNPDAMRLFPWIRFIWTNFGFLLFLPILAIIAGILTKRGGFERDRPASMLLGGALMLWIIPNIFQFQSWDFDTNKFFAYAILLSFASAGAYLTILPQRFKRIGITALIAITILSVPSSLIASWQIINYSDERRIVFFTKTEQEVAAWIREHTPEQSVFISSASISEIQTIQNPIVTGAGRKATIGFTTWLLTHGIDLTDRKDALETFLGNPGRGLSYIEEETEQRHTVPADYIIIDDRFRAAYPKLEEYLHILMYPVVYENGQFLIFSLQSP